MGHPDLQKLVFLERQYNEIKTLLPRANVLLAETHAIQKRVRRLFREWSLVWDRLQDSKDVLGYPLDSGSRDQVWLQSILFHALAFLIEAKRTCEAASHTQKLHKMDLLALLGQLSTQVLADPPWPRCPPSGPFPFPPAGFAWEAAANSAIPSR